VKVTGDDIDLISSQELEECGKENVVRVTIISKKFQSSLASAIERLIEAKLQIDKFGFTSPNIAARQLSPMVQNDEKRFSDKLTAFPLQWKSSIMPLTGERSTKRKAGPRLIREMRKVVELLADPYCELFRPLAIDYDLIEVNQGVCWSLKERSFVNDAIQEDKIGEVSPRAFSPFDST